MKPLASVIALQLLCLTLGVTSFAYGAEESASTAVKDAPTEGSPTAAKTPAKPAASAQLEPPPKTEYDRLPLPQLMGKADAGDLAAQFELALRYGAGRDLPKNGAESLRWLRRAAGAGHGEAARRLALMLYQGEEFAVDHVEAMRWAHMLASKGDMPAQMMLGNMYANGEGGPRDLPQAYMWYAIAAAGDRREADEAAELRLREAAELRDKLGTLLSVEQEAQAQKMAGDWWLAKYGPKPKSRPKATARKKAAPASRQDMPEKKPGKTL